MTTVGLITSFGYCFLKEISPLKQQQQQQQQQQPQQQQQQQQHLSNHKALYLSVLRPAKPETNNNDLTTGTITTPTTVTTVTIVTTVTTTVTTVTTTTTIVTTVTLCNHDNRWSNHILWLLLV